MRISTKLRIAAMVPSVMALGMLFGLAYSNQQTSRVHAAEAAAVRVSTDVNELNDLARSYVIDGQDRPRRQFEVKFREITQTIARARDTGSRYPTLMGQIADDTGVAGSLFGRLVASREATAARGSALAVQREERLAGQLFMRLRDANTGAVRLSTLLGADIVGQQQRVYALGTATTTATAIALTLVVATLLTSVNRSLRSLGEGTVAVGEGDLEHRIVLHGRDELSDLGRAFNRMAQRLQHVTVSRTELEAEVERRTELARQLDAQRGQLEAILGSMDEAVGVWSADGDQIRFNEATLRMYGFADAGQMRRQIDEFEDVVMRTMDGLTLPRDQWPAARVTRGESFTNWLLEVTVLSTGTRFVGSFSGAPVLDDAGTTLFGVVTVHDVTALQSAQERATRELATSQTLLEAADSLSRWMDVGDLLASLADLVLKACEHTRVGVVLVEGQHLRHVAGAGDGVVESGTVMLRESLPLDVQRMLESGRTTVVDLEALSDSERKTLGDTAANLALYIPIVFGDRVLACICVDDPGQRRTFDAREMEVIEGIAAQAAVALENARRFQVEHDIAERLQSALLEMPSRVTGLEFAQVYRSASESARVGGDFYDLFEIDSRSVGMTIGDVAGKGLNAAALTSLVKNAVRVHATEGNRSVAEVLDLTNEVVLRSTPSESFVTVLFGVFDLEERTFRYASAGHPPALVLCRDGTLKSAERTGPILGALPGSRYGVGEVSELSPGDVVLGYTDGLTEARAAGRLYGEKRVRNSLKKLAGRQPREVIERIMEDVLLFTGGELQDDVAVLAVSLSSGPVGAPQPD